MKTYLCLDTCTWIYLANGTEPTKFLEDIYTLMEEGILSILLPQVVLDEWNRNKDKGTIQGQVNNYFKDLNKNIREISTILDKIDTHPTLSFILEEDIDIKKNNEEIKVKLQESKSDILKVINKNITKIDNIFKHRAIIKIDSSDEILLKAGQFALDKKAPLHKKNGFADAVIVLSFLKYVEENSIEGATFISYNIEDFCRKENKTCELHPDLKPLFELAKSKFHHTLARTLKDIDTSLVDDNILKFIEENQDNHVRFHCCTECDGYDGIGNEIDFWEPFEIENENEPNYLNDPELPFDDFERSLVKRKKIVNNIQIGFCNHCSAQYIKCQNCQCVILVDKYADSFTIVCEECGLRYHFGIEYDRKGQRYETYKILKDDVDVCAKCGKDFNDENLIGICNECDEEYNDR